MKCIIPSLLAVFICVQISCSKRKPPATTDRSPELLSLSEAIVSDLNVISIATAHSHSIVHSEVQLTADVSVKFDSEGDAQRISTRIRAVFENAGYTTLFFNELSQGYDRLPGERHIGAGGWTSSESSHFDPTLGVLDRHVGVAGGSGDVSIRERLLLSAVFSKGDDRLAFHLWLFPEQGRCYSSLSIINQG